MSFIGRIKQKEIAQIILESDKSEFVAVIGRRRVGKTFFIDSVFKSHICFRMTGIQDGSTKEQLVNFAMKLSEHMGSPFVQAPPRNWQEAFFQLKAYLKTCDTTKKQVIFIDELPWVYTARSGFLQKLAHFWNDFLSKHNHFVLVICGSATSWITEKIINDKGGLHNRISHTIHLSPFTLRETKAFLDSRHLKLPIHEIAKIYMTMGGIPFYLENIRKGETATTAIERMCFTETGLLNQEYNNLYKALFYNYQDHEAIVKALSTSQSGLSREEVLKKSKVQDGGTFNRTMEDLTLSGFVSEFTPYGRIKKGTLFRLNDEFSAFYHRFIETHKKYSKGIWLQLSVTQSYKIWLGYAFENLCIKHIDQVKDALGIAAVYTEISSFRKIGKKKDRGFQIDLLIDRKDEAINLCEMKYHTGNFTVDARYAKNLEERRQLFIEHTKTKKTVFNTLVVSHGMTDNIYAKQTIDAFVKLEDLF